MRELLIKNCRFFKKVQMNKKTSNNLIPCDIDDVTVLVALATYVNSGNHT